MPFVESLLVSPLSKFTHFAANDCGYAGTKNKLLTNWVHLLCLEAKIEASKSDNPNQKSAMNGPFREEYWTAASKEIETLESMDAWGIFDWTDDMNVIDSIWAFKLK